MASSLVKMYRLWRARFGTSVGVSVKVPICGNGERIEPLQSELGRYSGLGGGSAWMQFMHGEVAGAGVYHFASGGRYEGQWERGAYHGYGVEQLARGSAYSGHFVEGLREGWGICQYHNGDRYEGHWKKVRPQLVSELEGAGQVLARGHICPRSLRRQGGAEVVSGREGYPTSEGVKRSHKAALQADVSAR